MPVPDLPRVNLKRLAPPPQGVPADAWAALEKFVQARAEAGRPLPEPAGGSGVFRAGPGCHFSYGAETLVWSPETGIRALRTEIFDRWKSSVRSLGWPVTSEYSFGGDFRTDFQKGTLMFAPRVGRIMSYEPVRGAVGRSYRGFTGRAGHLGGQGTVRTGLYSLSSLARAARATPGETARWTTTRRRSRPRNGCCRGETPVLVIIQGGGNDAYGPANAEIRNNAVQLIRELKRTYPHTRIVMVGVIGDGKGRRAEIDDLLARVAAEQGLDFLSPKDWWQRYSPGIETG